MQNCIPKWNVGVPRPFLSKQREARKTSIKYGQKLQNKSRVGLGIRISIYQQYMSSDGTSLVNIGMLVVNE